MARVTGVSGFDEGHCFIEILGGFCYTQLTDIDQELNGLLTYDRQPKVPPEEVAAIHRDLVKERM